MIPLYTPGQVQQMDRRAYARGVRPAQLMDLAAARVAGGVLDLVEQRQLNRRGLTVVAVCGKGNNGADGMAVVRHLRRRGVNARAVLLDTVDELGADGARELAALGGIGALAASIDGDEAQLAPALAGADLLVDCMLGTGASGAPRGVTADAVRAFLERGAAGVPIVACDLPTGVDATTGRIADMAVRADLTVTLGAHKLGLWLHPAAEHAGRLVLGELAVDDGADAPAATVLEASDLPRLVPPAGPRAHKRSRGVVVIYAGSTRMAGAAVLAARGALGAGAGLVTLATPQSVAYALTGRVPEVMLHGLPGDADSIIQQVSDLAQDADVLAIGPGLGLRDATQEAVRALVRQAPADIVLDADGINAFRDDPDLLGQREGDRALVLTPHAKEHGRLTGSSGHGVHARRTDAAVETATRFRATVVAKGPRSVVASPAGQVWVNPTGGPELSTGGTGDVLTGVTAALFAQGPRPSTVAAAVWLHGRAGELSRAHHGVRGTSAGTVAEHLGAAGLDVGI